MCVGQREREEREYTHTHTHTHQGLLVEIRGKLVGVVSLPPGGAWALKSVVGFGGKCSTDSDWS